MPIIDKYGVVKDVQNFIETISNNANPSDIMEKFGDVPIIGIEFPSHADGRGFSLAKRLRRAGFKGKLRAIGPVIPDQFPDLIACGFDEIQIEEAQLNRQPISYFIAALGDYSISYQSNNGEKIEILTARGELA